MNKLLLFFVLFLSFVINVNAATSLESDVFINNNALTTQNYIVVQPNTWFDLKLTMQLNVSDNTSSFVRLTMCFDGTITQYNTAFPNIFTDMLVVSTNQSCSYYNSTYKGKIVNLYFNYNATESASFTNNMEILSTGGSIGLLSATASDTPYDFSNGSDTIIDQNQTIIEGNNAIKDELGNLNDNLNEKFETCKPSGKNLYDYINNTFTGDRVLNDGVTDSNASFKSTIDFIQVSPLTSYTISGLPISSNNYIWFIFYDTNFNFIQRNGYALNSSTRTINTPSNAKYVKFMAAISVITPNISSLQFEKGTEATSYESYREICTNKMDETNSQLSDLNNSLNNSDTSDATNQAGDFFSGFQTDTFGLTSIITAPLNLIGNITSSSCSPVGLPLPYVDKTLNLPCLSSIYQQYFGSFLTIYQTITFGIVAYWVCIRIFALVKDFKNPDHDEIEVLDL